jgi:hypothetical protein
MNLWVITRTLADELTGAAWRGLYRARWPVEIIPGKGSGQLKKKVLRFLNQGHIRPLYHRVEKDDKNFGRIFIHFKFK